MANPESINGKLSCRERGEPLRVWYRSLAPLYVRYNTWPAIVPRPGGTSVSDSPPIRPDRDVYVYAARRWVTRAIRRHLSSDFQGGPRASAAHGLADHARGPLFIGSRRMIVLIYVVLRRPRLHSGVFASKCSSSAGALALRRIWKKCFTVILTVF